MAAVLTLVTEMARADPPAAEFSMRGASPPVGSHIKRDHARAAKIPLNLKYSEMSAEQQRAVKGQYEAMAEADEPPFPSDGLRRILDQVLKANSKLLVDGPMELVVDVDENGDAMAVSVLRSSSPEMTNFAARVLMLTKYKPAICGGQRCRMQYPLNINFALEYGY